MRTYLRLISIGALAVLAASACKVRRSGVESSAAGDQQQALAQGGEGAGTVARGKLGTDIEWEVHPVLPWCEHPGKPRGSWCEMTDADRARRQNTAEPALVRLVSDPAMKFFHVVTSGLVNRGLIQALCARANDPEVRMHFYVPEINFEAIPEYARRCLERQTWHLLGGVINAGSGSKTVIMATAVETVGTGGRQAAGGSQATAQAGQPAALAFGSGALSSMAFSLNHSVWQIFRTTTGNRLSQVTACEVALYEHAARTRAFTPDWQGRQYAECLAQAQRLPQVPGIRWAASDKVGSSQILRELVGATDFKRLVLAGLGSLGPGRDLILIKGKAGGAGGPQVTILADDDLLRDGKVNGGATADTHWQYVELHRQLTGAGAVSRYIRTNGEIRQNSRSKFMLLDDNRLLLDLGRLALVEDPDFVRAYTDLWQRLDGMAVGPDMIPESRNPDRSIGYDPVTRAKGFLNGPN